MHTVLCNLTDRFHTYMYRYIQCHILEGYLQNVVWRVWDRSCIVGLSSHVTEKLSKRVKLINIHIISAYILPQQ